MFHFQENFHEYDILHDHHHEFIMKMTITMCATDSEPTNPSPSSFYSLIVSVETPPKAPLLLPTPSSSSPLLPLAPATPAPNIGVSLDHDHFWGCNYHSNCHIHSFVEITYFQKNHLVHCHPCNLKLTLIYNCVFCWHHQLCSMLCRMS